MRYGRKSKSHISALMDVSEPRIRVESETALDNAASIASKNLLKHKQVLIVDDDPAISKILGDILRDWGFKVLTAFNGREGLHAVEANSIDGILLDLEMPVMDGWTMLDELRWRNEEIPVIVMSGDVPAETMRNVLREGAQGFLIKPFQLEDLQQKCSQIFGVQLHDKEEVPLLVS